MRRDRLGDLAEPRKDRAEQGAAGPLGRLRLRERGEDPLLGLRAEPAEVAQTLGLGRLAEAGDGRDPELLPDPARRLRPEPGQVQEARHLLRHLGLALRERVDLAVLDHLDDLLLDRLADPLELLRPTVERELGDGAAGLADPRRRAAIGGDAERVAALQLHQVGEQIELFGELHVPWKLAVP